MHAELERLEGSWGRTEQYCMVFDTLQLAREMHPGQRNSLDALCRRYEIDNAHRELHGALLDAELLAEVYLAMTGGQVTLEFGAAASRAASERADAGSTSPARARFKVIAPSAAEVEAHQRTLERIDSASGGRCVWLKS